MTVPTPDGSVVVLVRHIAYLILVAPIAALVWGRDANAAVLVTGNRMAVPVLTKARVATVAATDDADAEMASRRAPSPQPSTVQPSTGGPEAKSLMADASAPSPAPAASVEATPTCDLGCRERRILADTSVPLPAGWRVSVEPGRPGLLGYADPVRRLVRIHVRDGWTDAEMRYVLLHEYGHAWDFASLDGDQRARWMRQRGIRPRAWYPSCRGSLSCEDRTSPAGDWAEGFAYCHTGLASLFASQLAGLPDDADCRVLNALVPVGPSP